MNDMKHTPLRAGFGFDLHLDGTRSEPDQRDLCREWASNAAARAKEYRDWAEHYRERLAYCEEQAERHERIAKADLEAANG